jgi:hypothetical protein
MNLPEPTGLAKALTAEETMRAKIVREARIVESGYVGDSRVGWR